MQRTTNKAFLYHAILINEYDMPLIKVFKILIIKHFSKLQENNTTGNVLNLNILSSKYICYN